MDNTASSVIEITGTSGRTYTLIIREGRAVGCSCPSARFQGPGCKHQDAHNAEAAPVQVPVPLRVVPDIRRPKATPAPQTTQGLLTPAAATAFSDPLALIDDEDDAA